MIRGSAVVVICPNVALVIEVSGLLNCARLNVLKNSARNSTPTRSLPPKRVILATAKSKLVRLGPRKELRGSVPYVRNDGLVTYATDVAESSVRLKLLGLNQKLPVWLLRRWDSLGSRIPTELPYTFACTKFPSPAADGPGRDPDRLNPAKTSMGKPVR